uniref:Uncharacterized protein n=1 Tax=Cannabis sativa TaxID=3483 RepID=A0A803PZZ5_CANSA
MVSEENLAQASMARPSTHSQDGIPPPIAEQTTSKSNPDSTSAPIANPSMASRRPPPSRSRPSHEEDTIEPDLSSPVQPVPNPSQPDVSTRRPSLDRLADEDVSTPFFLSTAAPRASSRLHCAQRCFGQPPIRCTSGSITQSTARPHWESCCLTSFSTDGAAIPLVRTRIVVFATHVGQHM